MIEDIVFNILLSVLVFVLVVFLGLSVSLKIRNNKLVSQVAQLVIDREAILEELDRSYFISNNSIDIENGFIKFLSESRESAFEYIENVQSAILNLKDAMAVGDETLIATAYDKLIGFLPSDSADVVE